MERNFSLAGLYVKPHPKLIYVKLVLRVATVMIDFKNIGIG